MTDVKLVENSQEWEQFLLSQPRQPFMQSWYWGNVQENLGNEVFRFGIYKKNKLVGICLAVHIKAKRSHFLHLRHGPVLSDFNSDFDAFIEAIKKHTATLGVDFIRISPLLPQESFDISFLRKRGFRNAAIHNMDAENTWVLDLEKSEEELLANMRKTTRYLIRKAQKMPITITDTADKKEFEKFMVVYEDTSKRHNFIPHKGTREEWSIFTKENLGKLYLAYYEKKVIAGAYIVFYGDQAVYHHGVSASEYRDIPAPYLIQWAAICEAKRQGKKYYNFWGVVPENKPKHPWQGLTLFKMGFSGRREDFIHAQDLQLSPMYLKTYIIETLWKIKRGY